METKSARSQIIKEAACATRWLIQLLSSDKITTVMPHGTNGYEYLPKFDQRIDKWWQNPGVNNQ
jgi:hypothetical protein